MTSYRDLYAIQASNAHQSLLTCDIEEWMHATEKLNRVSLADRWQPPKLEFKRVDRRAVALPDLCSVSAPGVLALRADLLDALFPHQAGLEFLPLEVGPQQWVLVNCLNFVDHYDEARSNVMRDLSGNACLVLDLVIDESEALPEVFTLTNSNRAQLFATESFRMRVVGGGFQGISFQRMGAA